MTVPFLNYRVSPLLVADLLHHFDFFISQLRALEFEELWTILGISLTLKLLLKLALPIMTGGARARLSKS